MWELTSLSSPSPLVLPARFGPLQKTALPFIEDLSLLRALQVSGINSDNLPGITGDIIRIHHQCSGEFHDMILTYVDLCVCVCLPLQETVGTTSPPQPSRS